MNLLEEFIFSLSTSERQKLRPLQFRGVKRKIFTKILNCRTLEEVQKLEAIPQQHRLTESRAHQITSEILASCYHDVAPGGGLELIQYLGFKQLFRHLYNELRRQEALILAKNNRAVTETFYHDVLRIEMFFSIPQRGEIKLLDKLHTYTHKYISSKSVPHTHDHYLMDLAEISGNIDRCLLQELNYSYVQQQLNELEKIYDVIRAGDHHLLKFRTVYTLMFHYSRIIGNVEKAMSFYAEARNIIEASGSALEPISELFELDGELESARLRHQPFDIAHYKLFFHEKLLWGKGLPLSFMYRFFPLILEAGDFTMARSYIRNYAPHNLDLIRNDIAIYYWYLLILFYFYTGDLKKAERSMQKAIHINKGKNKSMSLEISFRRFDAFFGAMNLDPVRAEENIHRHIRYAESHGLPTSTFLKPLLELVRAVDAGKMRADEVITKHMEAIPAKHHRLMLESVYRRYFK